MLISYIYWQKQRGLFQGKVISSLPAIQRPGLLAHNGLLA